MVTYKITCIMCPAPREVHVSEAIEYKDHMREDRYFSATSQDSSEFYYTENLFLCSYNNNESLSSYLRKVEDETLRLSVLSTWTANVSAEDIVVDGCFVPGGTPIIQALGVGMNNPTTWQEGGLEE